MTWTKEDRSFKTLISKETTDSANKFFFNELGARTLNVHASEIWSDDIPFNDPAQAVIDGVAEQKTLFVLTEDLTVPNNQSWKAESPPGTRLADWISDKYGAGYTIRLFDNAGSEIFTTDPVGWFFDYQTGILTFSGNAVGKARPFKVTGYRYIGAKGGGGGGSGTKIYTTEAALLAAADSAGTQAYAQDTANFWYRRASTWQKGPNFSLVRRVEGPYTITVDPIAGDDAEWNDGTVTPLKTLNALFKLIPAAINRAYYPYWTPATPGLPVVDVVLKAGTHEIAADPLNPYATVSVDFSNVNITGELAAFDSFTIDSWSNDNTMLHKPAGDPAWVVDALVGKMLALDYSGTLYYYWIIANGTHDLTFTTDWTDWPTMAPVGTVVTLHELATKWVGPRPVLATGSHAQGGGGFNFIFFDGSAKPAPWFFSQYTGSLSFNSCLLRGTGGSGHFYFSDTDSPSALEMLTNCMFLNHYPGISTYNGQFIINSVAAVNTSRMLETRFHTIIDLRGSLYMRNSGDLIFNTRGARGFWTYPAFIYCANSGSIWAYVNMVESFLTVDGSGAVLLDGKAPNGIFTLSCGNRLCLKFWTIESITPANTLALGGYNPASLPWKYMSAADLKNLYGGHFDFGWGCEAISFP